MASSLASQRPTKNKPAMPYSGTMQHPVMAAYQEALRRGDQRAIEAQQLLSAGNPQQLRQVALNMLKQRGLNPENFIRQLGLR